MSKRNKLTPRGLELIRNAILAFSAAKGEVATAAIKTFMEENEVWADDRLTQAGAEKIKKFIADYRDTRLDDATAAAAKVRAALAAFNDSLVEAAKVGVDITLVKGVASITSAGVTVREVESGDGDDDEDEEEDFVPRKRAYPSNRPQKERPRFVPRVGLASLRLRVQL